MSRIFGIDLGTTHSLIATIENRTPRVLADPVSGSTLLPSVVGFIEDQVWVGTAAVELEARGDVDAVVIRSVKRYMGLGSADLSVEDRQRYTFVDTTSSVVGFKIGSRTWTPPQISAQILLELKR